MAEKARTFGIIRCADCGKPVERKSPMTVRCPECRKEYNRLQSRLRKRAKGIPKRQDDSWSICEKKETCEYSTPMSGTLICDYIGKTGHSRGCPVEGCTKYKKRKVKGE